MKENEESEIPKKNLKEPSESRIFKRLNFSASTEKRIDYVNNLKREEFLDKAVLILRESFTDRRITGEQHGQLFVAFIEKVFQIFLHAKEIHINEKDTVYLQKICQAYGVK